MTLQEIFNLAGVVIHNNWFVIIVLLSLIQISPIKLNPWTWLGTWVAKMTGLKAVSDKMDKLEEKVNQLENKVDGLDKKVDKNEAINARVRILHFGDEITADIHHSRESFDQVLDDITQYNQYCKDHPKFENDKTVITTQIIKETYHKLYAEHKI